MKAIAIVVLVLGLATLALIGYYLLVVVPQQQLLYLQMQQQAQQQQVQQAIAYCQSINQQYNFGTGGCEPIPIQVSVSNWVSGTAETLWNGIQVGWSNVYNYFGTAFSNVLNSARTAVTNITCQYLGLFC